MPPMKRAAALLSVTAISTMCLVYYLNHAPAASWSQPQPPPMVIDEEWLTLRRRIRRVCAERGRAATFRAPIAEKKVWYVMDNLGFGMCKNPKAGTNTISSLLLALTNVTETPGLNNVNTDVYWSFGLQALFSAAGADGVPVEDMRARLRGMFTMSFVRHPFARLVSAFHSWVLNGGLAEISAKVGGNFSAFAEHVLLEASLAGCAPVWTGGGCTAMNIHWRPYYSACPYCDIPFDFVGKTETLREDFARALRLAGLSGAMPPVEEAAIRSNPTRYNANRALSGKGKMDVVHHYFDPLRGDVRAGMCALYGLDFDLFGYDKTEFCQG